MRAVIPGLPHFKDDAAVFAKDGVALEGGVVAGGEVVAEVGAAAFGAGEGGLEDDVGDAAERLCFSEAAAGMATLGDAGEGGVAGGLRGEAFAQGGLIAEEAGAGPHGGLQTGEDGLNLRLLFGRLGGGVGRDRLGRLEGEPVGKHGLGGADAEDEALEQRVGGEAVGAMDAGAGGFASGVEAAAAGASGKVGADAAHEVVGSGADGDEIAGEVEMVYGEEGADAGEALVQVDADMAHVEINGEGRSLLAHAFARDGAGDDVAGGEFEQGVVALHEAFAELIA